jgi:hypothetical protein
VPGQTVPQFSQRQFPRGIALGQPPAVVGMLVEQIEDRPVRRLELMRAGDFDQLSRLGLGSGYV